MDKQLDSIDLRGATAAAIITAPSHGGFARLYLTMTKAFGAIDPMALYDEVERLENMGLIERDYHSEMVDIEACLHAEIFANMDAEHTPDCFVERGVRATRLSMAPAVYMRAMRAAWGKYADRSLSELV